MPHLILTILTRPRAGLELTVEVRTGILTGDNDLHTWLYITKPDGSPEALGFHPAPDGSILYGPGDVQAESVTKQYTSTSGPLSLTQDQYNNLVSNIAAQDTSPPNYSVLSLLDGVQCSMWAIEMLHQPGDANFANLRVWQDLNQDGVSQAGELKSLAELDAWYGEAANDVVFEMMRLA